MQLTNPNQSDMSCYEEGVNVLNRLMMSCGMNTQDPHRF